MQPFELGHGMKRSQRCTAANDAATHASVFRGLFAMFALVSLSACEQNSFVPPPPPKVDVAVPVQKAVTRFLEATGNTAPIKNVDLVARVQGVLQSINYKDGSLVKAGTTLFTIEPDTYKFKLEQAQAAEAGAQASLKQTELDFKRQQDLVARQSPQPATAATGLAVIGRDGSAVACDFSLGRMFGSGRLISEFGFLAAAGPLPPLQPMLAIDLDENEFRFAVAAPPISLEDGRPQGLAAIACGNGAPNLQRCRAASDARGAGLVSVAGGD